MNRTDDSSPRPRARRAYRLPEHGPLPDLPLYERLIEDGLAAADRRYSAVDHITARRLAIWLAPAARPRLRPRPGPFRRNRRHQPSPQITPARPRPHPRL